MIESAIQLDLLAPGHMHCPGCGASLSIGHVENLSPGTLVVMPTGCCPAFVGFYQNSPLLVQVMSVPFASTRDGEAVRRSEKRGYLWPVMIGS